MVLFLLGQDGHWLVLTRELVPITHGPSSLNSCFMTAGQVSWTKIKEERKRKMITACPLHIYYVLTRCISCNVCVCKVRPILGTYLHGTCLKNVQNVQSAQKDRIQSSGIQTKNRTLLICSWFEMYQRRWKLINFPRKFSKIAEVKEVAILLCLEYVGSRRRGINFTAECCLAGSSLCAVSGVVIMFNTT